LLPLGQVAEADVEFEERYFLAQESWPIIHLPFLDGLSLMSLGKLICAKRIENFLLDILQREKRGAFILLEGI